MILRVASGGGLIAVAQTDHAALSGRLAEAWDDELSPAFRTAVTRHDDVWRERDTAPPWDEETGLPQSFLALSPAERRAVWECAPVHAAPHGPETELWVVRHAVRLHERADSAELKALTAGLAERGSELVGELRTAHGPRFDDTTLARGTALLALLDTLSLRLALGVDEPVSAGVLMLRPAHEGAVAVAPWPFRGATVETHLLGRALPGPASSQAALDAAWAGAPVRELPVRLVPA